MAKRSNVPRPGFTLIELLVVVSIIALLIALVLPSLSMARQSAFRAVCASNQQQVYTAMVNYTVTDKYLPPLFRSTVSGGNQFDVILPYINPDSIIRKRNRLMPFYKASVIYDVGANEASELVNYGHLWERDFMDTVKVFFCPSMTHDDYNYSTPTNPWPREEPRHLGDEAQWKFWNDVFSSYGRRLGLSHEPFEDIDSGTAISSDVIMFPGLVNVHHGTLHGINVMYQDGGVQWIDEVTDYFAADYNDYDWYGQIKQYFDLFHEFDR